LGSLLTFSRAAFKQRVGNLSDLAPEALPYNSELIEYLREEKRCGRLIVLATAADERTASVIAEHLDLFDLVVASNGVRNLKGEEKARELVRRFGHKGFDYIGNHRTDLAIWREADGIIIVNASRAVSREAHAIGNVVTEIANQPALLRAAVRAMRPHQWMKNLLVFVPILTSRSFFDFPGLIGALCMFISFCFTASGIYLLNDLTDLKADRSHPRKRYRPLASGALPILFGVVLAAALIAIGFGLSALIGAAHLVMIYILLSLAYSLSLKEYPLLDVFVLSGLYTLRVIAGGVASQHQATLWLLAFSGFIFLSLALVKRVAEIGQLKQSSPNQTIIRRGYRAEDRQLLVQFGIASAFSSSVVLALFVASTSAFQQYKTPEILWALVPLVLFWQCRLWLATERRQMHDDPIIFASRDWVSWVVAGSAVTIIVLASMTTTILNW
jgi:4-hydroxybenzoate polyprenyltransferase